LPDGQLTTGQTYELVVDVGPLAPGETHELIVQGIVDTGFNPGQSDGWTHLQALVFDENGDRYHPTEKLDLNHETDQAGPDYVEIQGPLSLAGSGEQTIRGFASDQSAVSTIVLEIDGQEQSCQNPAGSAQWTCPVDLGSRTDGETVDLRVKAVDQHGFESGWFEGPSLVVDTTPPNLTVTNATTATFFGGLVGPDDTLLIGQLADNRLVDRVEVCEDNVCSLAQMLIDPTTLPQASYTYEDDPGVPLLVGQNNACSGGDPLVRTFTVGDSFV
ncbi:MAG: hypothetical protein GY835_18140, partial [bacterium]|nr:hypothetical protein [bacterium]